MQWDRRGLLRVSAATAAAYPFRRAFGKAPQQNADSTLSFEDAGGSTLNSPKRNNIAFCNAVKFLSRRGGGTLVIPPKVYPFSGTAPCEAVGVTVQGYGATFKGDHCRIQLEEGSSAYNIFGLTILETSGTSQSVLLYCSASNSHFKDVHLEKNPPAKGYIGFCEQQTSHCLFENLSFAGSNGIYLGGHDHEIRGGWADSYGHDDCWALKAHQYPCYNIQISGFQARGFSALVSIGSEIGSYAADDPDHKMFVRNVSVEDCAARECAYFAYIKPGGIGSNDYRDGVVEDVAIRNCTIEDKAGSDFRDGIFVSPGRGAIVRRLNVQDFTITARGESPAHQSIAGLYLLVLKSTNAAGLGASIEDVSASNVQCTDPFGGAATSSSAPGTPLHSLVAIEKQESPIGHVSGIQITDSQIDGCARMAVFVGPNIDQPPAFERCTFNDFAASIYGSADKGSVLANSPVILKDITAVPSPSAPEGTRGVMADGKPDKSIPYLADITDVSIATIAAAADTQSTIFSALRDTWISKVEVAVPEGVPSSSSDFALLTLRNSSNGKVMASASTSDGLLADAGTVYSFNGDQLFSGAQSCLPRGADLIVEFSHGGMGVDLINPTFTVHCVPYGIV